MNMNELLSLHEKALQDGKNYARTRKLYDWILKQKGKHFIGIVGPRGVGKTVLLKQVALAVDDSFYISLDTLGEEDLYDIARKLVERYRIRLLLLDEIHYQKEYDKKLKKIYDFLNVRVIFTGSVSLSLFESSYDLSRRARLIHLEPFSFRDFLSFKKNINLPSLSLNDIMERKWSTEHLRYEHHFEEYLKGGLMPFSLEEPEPLILLENILKTVMKKDIPTYARLRYDEIGSLERVVSFIGRSPVEGINYTSVARNCGITKYKSEAYISLFEKAFVLNPVFPAGTNVLREPKVLMRLPYRLLFKEYEDSPGALREDFFGEVMRVKAYPFQYLKSTKGAKTPDFLIKTGDEDIVIEVGGKGKGREQFKGISVKKKLILTHKGNLEGIKRPLSLIGFL